jgi:hypothetical protein
MASIFDGELITAGGIPYLLREGYPKFQCSQDRVVGQEKILLDTTNLTAFAIEYFKYGYVGFMLPLPVQMPGFPGLYCTEIDFEPFIPELPSDHSVTLPSGQLWRNYTTANITYKTLSPKETQGTTEFSRTTKMGGEFTELPTTAATWQDTEAVNTTANPRVGKLIPTFDHTLHIERLSSIPMNTMRSLIGKVNESTLFGAPQETLLFSGAQIDSKSTFSGTVYNVQLQIGERPTNWNKYYKPGTTPHFQYIYWGTDLDYDGDLTYELGPMQNLFT